MIGFVGTGTIGAPMAARLLDAGHALLVHDAHAPATDALAAAGAALAASPAEVAARCETVLLSLPGPSEVEAVVRGDAGLLAARGALRRIVDLSTNALALSRALATQAAEHDVHYLDAPVSGGAVAARDGKLAVMVGGDAGALEAVRPLLECFAAHVFHLGESGAGTLAKLVNNQVFLCASVLVQEAFTLGAKAGMDTDTLLEVLQASSAAPYLARAPLVLSGRYDLGVFALGIAAKDVALALESAAQAGVSLPVTAAAHGVYAEAVARGLSREDFHATLRVLEDAAGTQVTPPSRKRRGS